jgi:hypothetical protein
MPVAYPTTAVRLEPIIKQGLPGVQAGARSPAFVSNPNGGYAAGPWRHPARMGRRPAAADAQVTPPSWGGLWLLPEGAAAAHRGRCLGLKTDFA